MYIYSDAFTLFWLPILANELIDAVRTVCSSDRIRALIDYGITKNHLQYLVTIYGSETNRSKWPSVNKPQWTQNFPYEIRIQNAYTCSRYYSNNGLEFDSYIVLYFVGLQLNYNSIRYLGTPVLHYKNIFRLIGTTQIMFCDISF